METKEKFIHRDLSWIEFNRRVLEEAADERNPLLERIKFLAIFTSNLDEFFMVRMSGAKKLLASGYNKRDQFGFYPQELFAEIKSLSDELVRKFYEIYDGPIKEALEAHKIVEVERVTGGKNKYWLTDKNEWRDASAKRYVAENCRVATKKERNKFFEDT